MKGRIACLILLAAPQLCFAAQWYRASLGPFEAVSDSRPAALQALSQFEQFRYALGTAMGQSDLRLNPPLRILVFRDAKEMPAQSCDGIHQGRDHLMACSLASGQLPQAMVREMTRRLLEANFTHIPPSTVVALESFFSTVESNAVHVTWGAPPSVAERTRDWAILHKLITQPETSGRAHIFLHNLAGGMDLPTAIRSLGEDPAAFNAAVDRYMSAGVYQAVQAPNRPLSPDRDFVTVMLNSDDGQLARADLLGSDAAGIYSAFLKDQKHQAEANEGLGFLALKAGNEDEAVNYFAEAYKAGSRNVIAMTAYAKSEKHYDVAIDILKQALRADPKYAPAHWELGDKYDDPMQRLAEWKIALGLDPHNAAWWVSYARLSEGQKQWADAGRGWLGASEATSDPKLRAEYVAARNLIEQKSIDDEAAKRHQEAAAKEADINRLKTEARREVAALEARANQQNPKSKDNAPVVDWWEDDSLTFTGSLMRVDCIGKTLRLMVGAKTFELSDPSNVNVRGGQISFSCGVQKPRNIVVHYKPLMTPVNGIAGEITGIEYQ